MVDDLLVSRHHAELRERRDGRYELLDLRSANGTFVNGRRVERATLEERDVVTVGHHVFQLIGGKLEEYVDQGLVSFRAAGLTVRTPAGHTLLDDVSLGLEQRSFLAVVGPSGAGKSTLLNALTGSGRRRSARSPTTAATCTRTTTSCGCASASCPSRTCCTTR